MILSEIDPLLCLVYVGPVSREGNCLTMNPKGFLSLGEEASLDIILHVFGQGREKATIASALLGLVDFPMTV